MIRGADPARSLAEFAQAVERQPAGAGRRPACLVLRPAARIERRCPDAAQVGGHRGRAGRCPCRGRRPRPSVPATQSGLPSWRRAGLGAALSITLLSLATPALAATRHQLNLLSAVLVYLLVTVLVAWASGVVLAIMTALAATLLLNYFFTPPVHRFTISEANNALALAVFVLVSVLVAALLDRAERRRRQAVRASSEAELLATVAVSALRGDDSALAELMEQVREIFGMRAVTLLERDGAGWQVAAAVGNAAPSTPEEADAVVVAADGGVRLLLSGGLPDADDQRVLRAVASQAAAALHTERLAAEAERSRPLREVDRTRTALLAAVSHDLRTPLAGVKAAVSSLRDASVGFTAADRAELLATARNRWTGWPSWWTTCST